METAFTFCDSCNPNAKIIGQEGRGYVGLPKSSVREFGWGQIDGKDICAECIEEQGLIIPKSISSQILHKNTKSWLLGLWRSS